MSTPVSKPKRQKYNLGSIVAIPLPEGKYAFGKVYTDQMAIYDLVLDHIPEISKVLDKQILFFQPNKIWFCVEVCLQGNAVIL